MENLQDTAKKAKSSYAGTLVLSAAMTAVAHPLTYVKVLIQVGHEPLPPQPTKTLFGRTVLRLPNFYQYAKHIKSVDGWLGLYRGLGPRIAHNVISSTITNSVTSKYKELETEDTTEEKPKEFTAFLKETGKIVVARTAGIVASYPLHVISIRMMVQFVGRETYYRSILSSIKEIYEEDGILGFFSGLIPHLLGEIITIWLFRTMNYVFIEKILPDEEFAQVAEIQTYSQGISQYVASTLTYPFTLVTNLMAVNDTRLVAGNPPLMPIYESWTECWIDLGKKGLRGRGSTLFRRTVTKL